MNFNLILRNGKEDLIEEAKKYKNAGEFIEGLEKKGKIMYHGTNKKFDKFDLTYLGKGEGSAMAGKGINLVTDIKGARNYAYKVADRKGGDEVIKKIYTDVKNKELYNIDKLDFGEIEGDLKDFLNYVVKNQKGLKEIKKGTSLNDIEKIVDDDLLGAFDGWTDFITKNIDGDIITEYVKNKGYKGIITKSRTSGGFSGTPETNITIFDPKNIKTEVQLKEIYKQAHKKLSKKEYLIEEAKKYRTAEEFIETQPKLYRGQGKDSELKSNSGDVSNTVGDAFYFTDDKKLAEKYGKFVKEIPFLKENMLSKKEVDNIIKEAQVKLDKLVKDKIYEGPEYDKWEALAIGNYPDIARILEKPFIKTGNYNDTEILYYPKYDKTEAQLKKIWEQTHK